jgi:hypothetical protein
LASPKLAPSPAGIHPLAGLFHFKKVLLPVDTVTHYGIAKNNHCGKQSGQKTSILASTIFLDRLFEDTLLVVFKSGRGVV